jgi:hypothetical protein
LLEFRPDFRQKCAVLSKPSISWDKLALLILNSFEDGRTMLSISAKDLQMDKNLEVQF